MQKKNLTDSYSWCLLEKSERGGRNFCSDLRVETSQDSAQEVNNRFHADYLERQKVLYGSEKMQQKF